MSQHPLSGRCFLLTQAPNQTENLASLLEQQGATSICIPTVEIVPPESLKPLDQALVDLDLFQIVILTSVNAVEIFFERLVAKNQYIGMLYRLQVVALDPRTAAAIQKNHARPKLITENHSIEGIIAALLQQGVKDKKILCPQTESVTNLVEQLTAAGAEVVAPVAYRTQLPKTNAIKIRAVLEQNELDAICLGSPSEFTNLLELLGNDATQRLEGTKLFSIDHQTSQTIREHGLTVALEPEQNSLDSLMTAMVEYFRKEP